MGLRDPFGNAIRILQQGKAARSQDRSGEPGGPLIFDLFFWAEASSHV